MRFVETAGPRGAARPATGKGSVMNILVLEDNELTLGFIATTLRRAGHRVVTAPNGHAGIRLFDQQGFDLAITDVFMPDGDGLEFLRHVRATGPDTPVLAISGGARSIEPDFLDAAALLGAAATLCKPFEAQDLVRLVAQFQCGAVVGRLLAKSRFVPRLVTS
jgi:CheY-like chemotaxis protein